MPVFQRLGSLLRRGNVARASPTALNNHSNRRFSAFGGEMIKFIRPDRWRVEAMPLAEPYHHRKHFFFHEQFSPDGDDGPKRISWEYIFGFYYQFLWWYWMYFTFQFLYYENLYTWGKEEALHQLNKMSMRDEEKVFLWVKFNDMKYGVE